MSANLVLGAGGAAEAYTIDQSLHISNEIDSYLSKQYSVAGNQRTWTISVWVKRAKLDDTSEQHLLNYSQGTSHPRGGLRFYPNSYAPEESLVCQFNGMATAAVLSSSAMYVDPASWYHVVCGCDTTLSDSSNRYILYVNGERLTSFSDELQPNQNDDTAFGQTGDYHTIGRWSPSMYIAEFHFLDGIQATASDFGKNNPATNQWVPIEYDGSYGTNGFYQKYVSAATGFSATGNAQLSTSEKKFGTASLYCDGVGDHAQAEESNDFKLGTGDFTFEGWFKYEGSSDDNGRFLNDVSSANQWSIYMNDANSDQVYALGSSGAWGWSTDSDWHHWAFVRTSGSLSIYLDGSAITNASSGTTSQTLTTDFSSAGQLSIGGEGTSDGWKGYIDEFRFGKTSRYSGNFSVATSEFSVDDDTLVLMHFNGDNASTVFLNAAQSVNGIGKDYSGNNNDFDVINLLATDQMQDSPTNNFCTLNPLILPYNSVTYSEGNLKAVMGNETTMQSIGGTISVASGKWYWEIDLQSGSGDQYIGIIPESMDKVQAKTIDPQTGNGIYYRGDGYKRIDGTATSYGASYTDPDIMGVALDMDGSTVTFYKNNTSQGSIAFSGSVASASIVIPFFFLNNGTYVANFGQDSSFAGNKTAQGNQDGNNKGDFYYTPPTGFLALCTSNMSTPEIADPTDHFNTILYDDGAGAKTGVGSQPDLVWVKSRGSAYEHEWTDAVRGVTKAISSDSSNAETTDSTGLTAFGTDGFTVGADTNYSDTTGAGMVAWNWKANGSGSANTDGTISSTVSANTTAGFSIVSYTGDGGSSATIGHGLSQAPELVMVKNRDAAENWVVGSSKGMDFTDYMILNTNAAAADDVGIWNDTAPTATVFTIGTSNLVNDTDDYIAYCFHSIEGYSKINIYEGNGNVNGSFIYTGFRPAFVMTKSIDSTSDWQMFDDKREGYNVDNDTLIANDTTVESTTDYIDILSNGFKNRIATDPNVAETYLYIAFAESPFKTANAR